MDINEQIIIICAKYEYVRVHRIWYTILYLCYSIYGTYKPGAWSMDRYFLAYVCTYPYTSYRVLLPELPLLLKKIVYRNLRTVSCTCMVLDLFSFYFPQHFTFLKTNTPPNRGTPSLLFYSNETN